MHSLTRLALWPNASGHLCAQDLGHGWHSSGKEADREPVPRELHLECRVCVVEGKDHCVADLGALQRERPEQVLKPAAITLLCGSSTLGQHVCGCLIAQCMLPNGAG